MAKSDNKDIIEKSQKLIQELCTYEEMKKIIFENNDEIKEIFSNPNLEIRFCVFDILIAEFEKERKR